MDTNRRCQSAKLAHHHHRQSVMSSRSNRESIENTLKLRFSLVLFHSVWFCLVQFCYMKNNFIIHLTVILDKKKLSNQLNDTKKMS